MLATLASLNTKALEGSERMLVAKKLAIALAVLMLAIVAWGLFLESNAVTIVINGQQVTGPLKGVIGAGDWSSR